MKFFLVGLNARFTHSCLALFYVRNELERNIKGAEPEIVQFTINDPYYQMLLKLSGAGADCYFFSAVIWNSDLITKLIADLLQILPACRVVVGGPQAEIVGSAVNNDRLSIMVGEIEGVGSEFYRDLANKSLRAKYSCSRSGSDFSFPYRDSDFPTHLRNRHIYYESSRGCPFSCTYCLSSSQPGVFHKDIEQVQDELSRILRFNPKVVRFIDRTFNDNAGRTLAIWRFLKRQQTDTVFHFEISPSRFTEEMLELLRALPVGKFQFEIGIQSTNKETLQAIRRPLDISVARQTVTSLARLGNIHLHVDLILGLPFETKESFLESFRNAFAMNPHYIQMGLLKILPDTPICQTVPEYHYLVSSAPPYSVIANNWLDHTSMQELYWLSECVERFMNNRYFVSLWQYFRDEQVDIATFFLEVLSICLKRDFFSRAPTQEFLLALLVEATRQRTDQRYIVELLCYDWLRCGHRYLPPGLKKDETQDSRELKKLIYRVADEKNAGLEYDTETRQILKKGFVHEFSQYFMEKQGLSTASGCHFLCFHTEREQGLYAFNRFTPFFLPRHEASDKNQLERRRKAE